RCASVRRTRARGRLSRERVDRGRRARGPAAETGRGDGARVEDVRGRDPRAPAVDSRHTGAGPRAARTDASGRAVSSGLSRRRLKAIRRFVLYCDSFLEARPAFSSDLLSEPSWSVSQASNFCCLPAVYSSAERLPSPLVSIFFILSLGFPFFP